MGEIKEGENRTRHGNDVVKEELKKDDISIYESLKTTPWIVNNATYRDTTMLNYTLSANTTATTLQQNFDHAVNAAIYTNYAYRNYARDVEYYVKQDELENHGNFLNIIRRLYETDPEIHSVIRGMMAANQRNFDEFRRLSVRNGGVDYLEYLLITHQYGMLIDILNIMHNRINNFEMQNTHHWMNQALERGEINEGDGV